MAPSFRIAPALLAFCAPAVLAAATGTTTAAPAETATENATEAVTAAASTRWSDKTWCQRGEDCWPTQADIDALSAALDPNTTRILAWTPGQEPPPCAIPLNSPFDQPLFGAGVTGLKPVYVESEEEANSTSACFVGPDGSTVIENATETCYVSVRMMPQENWKPSFVVWPVTKEQVQESVKFAVKHNLCIMVTGPGHDILNRHSCPDGVQIRTSLLKDAEWDLTDEKGFGHKDGSVKFGPGVTWSEVQKAAAENDRVISSGWCPTVGIMGWHLGAGHGPFAPGFGNGGDNILELEVVLANGTIVTANATENEDLYWAMRGGGGSTWGVVTAITVRAHKIPKGGFTTLGGSTQAPLCGDGLNTLNKLVDDFYIPFVTSLDSKWGGYVDFTPQQLDPVMAAVTNCTAGFAMAVTYVFRGPANSTEFTKVADMLKEKAGVEPEIANYATWWDKIDETLKTPGGSGVILPTPFSIPSPTNVGGVPSVLVSREIAENGTLAEFIKGRMIACKEEMHCVLQSLAADITGNVGSPQPKGMPFSKGYRSALIHIKNDYDTVDMAKGAYTPESIKEILYPLGKNSYFGESAYLMENWPVRYWGEKNYARLVEVKKQYDPESVFGCHHCVGDE